MTAQPAFSFAPVRDRMREKVPTLIAALSGRGWRTRTALASELGWTIREVRAVASASEDRIIGGSKGYCLLQQAPVEDVHKFIAFLQGVSTATKVRAMRAEKALHHRQQGAA